MLQGAIVNDQPKSISAARPKKPGPHARAKERSRDGHVLRWKRINEAFYDNLEKLGANPAMVAPTSRWVLAGHLTKMQGLAAFRYADIVRKFEKFFSEGGSRSPRSADLEPVRKGSEDVIRKHIVRGTLDDYEADARKAKSQYRRLMKVLDRYRDPVTGRNFAKDHLDTLCLEEREPDAQFRKDIAGVLGAVAKEFGLDAKRGKIVGGKV
jgi:hypothetical protein